MKKSALIIVDVQNDFCPGGSLAVPGGAEVVVPINTMIERFRKAGQPVFATRDWHPSNHSSFAARGGSWPPHCVQGTPGARFHPGLNIAPEITVVNKATEEEKDAYSGFEGTDLLELLRASQVERVYTCGLATDYCVKATTLDAIEAGFETCLVEDAVRGVNVNPHDSAQAIDTMLQAGATRTTSDKIEF